MTNNKKTHANVGSIGENSVFTKMFEKSIIKKQVALPKEKINNWYFEGFTGDKDIIDSLPSYNEMKKYSINLKEGVEEYFNNEFYMECHIEPCLSNAKYTWVILLNPILSVKPEQKIPSYSFDYSKDTGERLDYEMSGLIEYYDLFMKNKTE